VPACGTAGNIPAEQFSGGAVLAIVVSPPGRPSLNKLRSTRSAPLAALLAALSLGGCTTVRLTEPGQTATERLLISSASSIESSRRAARSSSTPQDNAPGDAALYSKYALASVRDRLLRQGAHLVDDRKSADMIVEPRTGAQSIDHDDLLIGLPSIPIPIPLAGTVTPPRIAFSEKDHQIGVAKIAIRASARDGALVTFTAPGYGGSNETRQVALFFSWKDSDLPPKEPKEWPPRPATVPQTLRLLPRWADALDEFFANGRIVLRELQD
jgi:hypothetical protein